MGRKNKSTLLLRIMGFGGFVCWREESYIFECWGKSIGGEKLVKIRNGENNWYIRTLNRQAKIISRVPLEGGHLIWHMKGTITTCKEEIVSVNTIKFVTLAEKFKKCKPSFLYFRTWCHLLKILRCSVQRSKGLK